MLPPKVMGLCALFCVCLFSYEQLPLLCLVKWGQTLVSLWCFYALLVSLWTFPVLKKKIKVSVMHFHLSTLMFFPDVNWCCLDGGI